MYLKLTNFYQHQVMKPFSAWTHLRYWERNRNWLEFIKVFRRLWSRICPRFFQLHFENFPKTHLRLKSAESIADFSSNEIKKHDTFSGFNQYDAISLHFFSLSKTWRETVLKSLTSCGLLWMTRFVSKKLSNELELEDKPRKTTCHRFSSL